MPLTGNFTFVLIPGDINEPIREIQASKSGGLEKDALLQFANEYFASQQSSSSSSSVNITAVTVPTNDNNYTACSIYSITPDNQPQIPPPILNQRATDLLTACGHTVVMSSGNTDSGSSTGSGNAIYGDAFCGRAYDDERTEWERMDMTAIEIDIKADWCRMARKLGGGGGTGRTSTPSLSNLAQQIMSNPNSSSGSTGTSPMEIIQDTSTPRPLNNYGMDGNEPVVESWGTWIQSNDDIEVRIFVPITTTSKQCQIQFHKNSLKVAVNNETILEGTTYDPIAIDECTYTLQDMDKNERSGSNELQQQQRELCITIGKVEVGRTWMYIVK